MQGQIISIGSGKYFDNGLKKKTELNIGDKVLFPKWSGSEIKIDDKKYLIMRESDIFGKIIQ